MSSFGTVNCRRRRGFAALALSGLLVTGCAGSDGTGLGIDLVSEEQVQEMGVESWQRLRSETPASAGLPAKRRARSVVTTAGGRSSGAPKERGDT